jgi:hypothetical protein
MAHGDPRSWPACVCREPNPYTHNVCDCGRVAGHGVTYVPALAAAARVERVARVLCRRANPMIDPDTLTYGGVPLSVSLPGGRTGFVVPGDAAEPLWRQFVSLAETVVAAADGGRDV